MGGWEGVAFPRRGRSRWELALDRSPGPPSERMTCRRHSPLPCLGVLVHSPTTAFKQPPSDLEIRSQKLNPPPPGTLCDLGQDTSPFWPSPSPSIKWADEAITRGVPEDHTATVADERCRTDWGSLSFIRQIAVGLSSSNLVIRGQCSEQDQNRILPPSKRPPSPACPGGSLQAQLARESPGVLAVPMRGGARLRGR